MGLVPYVRTTYELFVGEQGRCVGAWQDYHPHSLALLHLKGATSVQQMRQCQEPGRQK